MLDAIREAYQEIKGKVATEATIEHIANNLPSSTIAIGKLWGWNDTDFNVFLYKWIRENI